MSSSSSPYTASYPPAYTTLWSVPPPPTLARPSSPPRRAGAASASAYDARTQVYLAELQHTSQARAGWYHATGNHLPSRSPRDPLLDPTIEPSVASGSNPTVRQPSEAGQGSARNRWRARWSKEDIRMREAAERGWHWSGSGVTQEEEKDLNEEEAERHNYRETLLTYGRNSIVVLGRGRTTHEEQLDAQEREAPVTNFRTSSDDLPGNITEGQASEGAELPTGSNRRGRGRGGRDPMRGQADDDAPYEGEYTLDNGMDADGGSGEDGEGGGRDSRGGAAGMMAGNLDAGMESMD